MNEKRESPELAAFRRTARAFIEQQEPAPPSFKLPQSFLEVESSEQFGYMHFYFKRSLWSRGALGGGPHHRRRLASALLWPSSQ